MASSTMKSSISVLVRNTETSSGNTAVSALKNDGPQLKNSLNGQTSPLVQEIQAVSEESKDIVKVTSTTTVSTQLSYTTNVDQRLDGFVPNEVTRAESQSESSNADEETFLSRKRCKITRVHGKSSADCSGRNLTGIPPDLPQDIQILNLSNNRISNLSDGLFSKLNKLLSLNIESNTIQDVSGNAFSGLPNLTELDLSNNEIDVQNPSGFCSRRPLRSLKKLARLDLSGLAQQFNETFPDQCLSDLQHLTYLHITVTSDFNFSLGFKSLQSLKHLDLSRSQGLTYVKNSFFKNLETLHINVLSVTDCCISGIDPKALVNLPHLRILNLSNNIDLGLEKAFQALKNNPCPRLEIFNTSFVTNPKATSKVTITASMFAPLRNTSLRRLLMDSNNIGNIEEEAIQQLPISLIAWNLRNNKLSKPPPAIKNLHRLTHLQYLNAFNQGARRLATHTAVPESYLVRPKNRTIILPPKLQFIKYTQADRFYFGAEQVYFVNSSLETVDFSFDNLKRLPAEVFGLEKLKYLILEHNEIGPSNTFFNSFPELTSLFLRANVLKPNFENDFNGHTLRKLTKLEALRLGKNGITKLYPNVFQYNYKMAYLNLGNNKLNKLGCRIGHMKGLKKLVLSGNSIDYLETQAIEDLETVAKYNRVLLDLTQNPLVCSCNSLPFLKWTLALPPNITIKRFDHQTCISDDGKTRLKLRKRKDIVERLEIKCATHFILIISLSLALLTSLLVTSGGLIYRYRWKIRYFYHTRLLRKFLGVRKTRRRNGYSPINGDELDNVFDVFISYADCDRQFVIHEMLPVLEKTYGLKVYIRDRDSIPGLENATNIIGAVSCSKVSVLLVSEGFLQNHWCNYEFQIARVEGVIRKQAVLLFLLCDDISPDDIPDDLMREVHRGTHLEVPKDTVNTDDMHTFWTMFVREINKYGVE